MSAEPQAAKAGEAPPIQVSFDWDGLGGASLAQYVLDTEPGLANLERRVRRVRVLPALVWGPLVIFVTYQVMSPIAGDGGGALGLLLGVLFVLLGLMVAFNRVGAWAAFRAKLQERAATGPRGPTVRLTVTADVQGITTADENRSVTYRWKSFDQVIRIPDYIAVVFTNTGSGVTIPLSAFECGEAADAFEGALRRLLVSSGFERTDRIRVMLAETSIVCECGHDLRGLAEPQCPECGRQFTVLSLTIFRALRLSWWKLAAIKQRQPHVTEADRL